MHDGDDDAATKVWVIIIFAIDRFQFVFFNFSNSFMLSELTVKCRVQIHMCTFFSIVQSQIIAVVFNYLCL